MSVTYPGLASPDADDAGLNPEMHGESVMSMLAPWAPTAVLSRIAERIPTEAAAYEYLEDQRWRGSPVCPHCGVVGGHVFLRPANGLSRTTNRGKQSQRRVWKCHECKRQFSVITGTVMHGTHVPIRTWVLVSFEVTSSPQRLNERDVARRYGLSSKSAHFLLQRIRDDLRRTPEESLFAAVASTGPAEEPLDEGVVHVGQREPLLVGAPSDATPPDAVSSGSAGVISMW